MQDTMTRRRPLVGAEDDSLFSADQVHWVGPWRRASITVAEVEEIQRRTAQVAAANGRAGVQA
ncbi:hypothetical protein AB0M94_39520 [Streptomyces xanthochromogenes]|uniref:hypothetical protein n=1 Tax=Streptomyces xanthochromogenes TaxID=67384 RepID=UPI0034342ACA